MSHEIAIYGRRWHILIARIGIVVFFIMGLELVVSQGIVRDIYLSRPSVVVSRSVSLLSAGDIYYDIWLTMYEVLLAFGLGALLGLATGYIVALTPWLDELVRPFIDVANAVPKIVLAPLFALWFGVGPASKVALAFSLVYFIVFFSVFEGVRNVDPGLVRKLHTLGASWWQRNRYVYFPAGMAWFISSLRLSMGFALIGVITGEYIASARGVGHLIAGAQRNFDTATVFSGILILSVIVLLMSFGLARLERWALRWRGT